MQHLLESVICKLSPVIVKMIKTNSHDNQSWSYQQQIGTFPLRAITAGQLLAQAAEKYPRRMAVVSAYQSKRMTFGELLVGADVFGAGLMRLGLMRGEHVGVWSPNSIEWVVIALACARAGYVLVQLNHSYKAYELLYSVNKARIKVLVCGVDTPKQHYYDILRQVDGGMFANGDDEGDGWPKVTSEKMASLQYVISLCKNKGTISYNDVPRMATKENVSYIKENQHLINMDDPLNIQFTSGSTGLPKAALLSHHNVVNNSFAIGNRFELDNGHHSICVNVPFFHTFGTTAAIFCALHFGTTLILPYDFYDPRKSLQTIHRYKCSVIYGTPTMYVDLIAAQRSLRLRIAPSIICTGGAATTPQLIKDIYEHLTPGVIVNICGMTESTAVFYQSHLHSSRAVVENNLGYLGAHMEAKVIDHNNNLVAIGTPGELCVRGYATMLGYYDDETLTAHAFAAKGWLKTGDKFIMFDDGSGQHIGRIKDIIIRGGENILPKEIEDYVSTHPAIIECQVVGLPDARLGEMICACVRLQAGAKDFTLADLRAFCDGKVAHYKVPARVFVCDEYPKTTSGKIQKYRLVEMLQRKELPEGIYEL